MFQPVNHSKHAGDLPRNCTFAESDWRILASFWHPVAYVHEIVDKPVKARLLDVDLVLYRTSEGVSVAKDICPHRGTRLSGGWVEDGTLVCPMHGLCFDHSGACIKVPSISDPNARIPPKLRLMSVLTEVRYGIVFVCLSGELSHPIPLGKESRMTAWKRYLSQAALGMRQQAAMSRTLMTWRISRGSTRKHSAVMRPTRSSLIR